MAIESKNIDKSHTVTIEVSKSPQDVFNSFLEVSKWWSKDFEGSSTKLDDEFVICHPGTHYSKHKLIEVMPNTRVVWLVTESKLDWLENDKAEWTGTKMIFELSPKGTNTVIKFTHLGLVPEKECYERVTQGWNMIIKERLFNFIARGKTV